MSALDQMLQQTPYVAYPYAYPHKTAYGPIEPATTLSTLWAEENRAALFLYLHIPFCQRRCGYCNLFTVAHPSPELKDAYLVAMERQARQVRSAMGQAGYARLAIGGGTPTCLEETDLEWLFALVEREFGLDLVRIPASVEVSPETATRGKLRLLCQRGVQRISIGVQSFVQDEVAAAGRFQQTSVVEQTLEHIRQEEFPILNIDLIYGLPGQTVQSWARSLQAALRYQPEELYLYPLYVRPLTGLKHRGQTWDDVRLDCYRAGRTLLLQAGYRQISMRLFRRGQAPAQEGPAYSCQQDGMVGLGCGARSYTRRCHYSSEYAVGRKSVQAILDAYINRPAEDFAQVRHGFRLNQEEEHRRYVIKSLLRCEGLDLAAYRSYFGRDAVDCLPQLQELLQRELAVRVRGRLQLTEAGLERSDTIGPWLYSARVRSRMEDYTLR